MQNPTIISDDPRVLNVFQIIVLDTALSASLLVGLKAAGMGWAWSMGTAWVGGCVLTLAAALAYAAYAGNRRGRSGSQTAQEMSQLSVGPPLVPDTVTDPMHLWEADRLAELDFALSVAGQPVQMRKPRRSASANTVRLWDEDNAADNSLALSRPRCADRC